MSKHFSYIYKVLDSLRKHVELEKFPKKKDHRPVYALPEYINGLPLKPYMVREYGLDYVDADFIIGNLRNCDYIQPLNDGAGNREVIEVGQLSGNNVRCVDVLDNQFGKFQIRYSSMSRVYNPKNINESLTTYICSNGITAFVHEYIVGGGVCQSIYFSSQYDRLKTYVEMMVPSQLWKSYIYKLVTTVDAGKEGEYYDSYH